MLDINISVLFNQDIQANIENIARLRLQVFLEYPYLYEGDMASEADYLKKFANTSDSIAVTLYEHGTLVGVMTGLPLKDEEYGVKAPWLDNEINIEHIYYFSEILLLPMFRNKGLGKMVFQRAEAEVATFNRYSLYTLATVIRPETHPLKPKGYRDSEGFWRMMGYQKSEKVCHMPWQEVGEIGESDKPLAFWFKHIHS